MYPGAQHLLRENEPAPDGTFEPEYPIYEPNEKETTEVDMN